MKHFPTNFGSLIRQKMTVVLAALALLGLVASASVFMQPASSAHAASRTTAASVHIASGTTSPSNTVAGMIYEEFGPYGDAAVRVATCESGLNPSAYNPTSIGGSHAEGVFQILYTSTWNGTPEAGSSPYNARANIRAAHYIFVHDGYSWREWSCKP